MSERFYNWLRRKYGFGEAQFREIERDDPEWADSLVREFSSIAASY